ncbi:MAG: pseudouridine synthase [Nannocystaceae bacterium]
MDPPIEIELLHVDDQIVAALKPSGLLVHRGWAQDTTAALQLVRDAIGQRVHPLHRLDRGTSGVLLFARDRDTARTLSSSFQLGHMEKNYLALVRGRISSAGRIDYPIPRRDGGPRVDASTSYRPVAQSPVDRCTLVDVRPHTGRLHQIRRHLRHLTHPLIGDVRYGDGRINRRYRENCNLHRLALHAWRLAFDHPTTGLRVTIEATLPNELVHAFARLGLPTHLPTPAPTSRES